MFFKTTPFTKPQKRICGLWALQRWLHLSPKLAWLCRAWKTRRGTKIWFCFYFLLLFIALLIKNISLFLSLCDSTCYRCLSLHCSLFDWNEEHFSDLDLCNQLYLASSLASHYLSILGDTRSAQSKTCWDEIWCDDEAVQVEWDLFNLHDLHHTIPQAVWVGGER